MARYELNKTIEAAKLKPSGAPLGEEGAIPFGAIIEDLQEDGSWSRFAYLGQLYRCKPDVLHGALKAVGGKGAASASRPASAETPAAKLVWEELQSDVKLRRAKVPGGWLLAAG